MTTRVKDGRTTMATMMTGTNMAVAYKREALLETITTMNPIDMTIIPGNMITIHGDMTITTMNTIGMTRIHGNMTTTARAIIAKETTARTGPHSEGHEIDLTPGVAAAMALVRTTPRGTMATEKIKEMEIIRGNVAITSKTSARVGTGATGPLLIEDRGDQDPHPTIIKTMITTKDGAATTTTKGMIAG